VSGLIVNLLKTIIFTVIVPGTVSILIPYWLLSSRSAPPPANFGSLRFLGVLPILLGASIYLWCAWDFTFAGRGTPAPIDPPKTLVVRGLYRYVRNPMYVGVLAIILGEALLFASPRLFGYAAIVFVCFYLFVVLYEEPTLRRKFGESYEKYCRTVPRWLPVNIRST
jgi:protein-S-isoprenylcysteine O-methyltransferase Ste14